MKYVRFTIRVLFALTLAALAFFIGLFLPLSVEWVLHGDPGMPGGASLAIVGFPLGVIAAVIAGLYSFTRLDPRKELSK